MIVFKNPKPPLLASLRGSGPIPGEPSSGGGPVNGERKRESGVGGGAMEKKKKKGGDGKGVDMDKLAEGLQKLGEDDLLQVVQMVHDNKNEESWMRNDVERKCKVMSDVCHDAMLTIDYRRRVPRRPIHTTRQSHQDAMGLHERTGSHHGRSMRDVAEKRAVRVERYEQGQRPAVLMNME